MCEEEGQRGLLAQARGCLNVSEVLAANHMPYGTFEEGALDAPGKDSREHMDLSVQDMKCHCESFELEATVAGTSSSKCGSDPGGSVLPGVGSRSSVHMSSSNTYTGRNTSLDYETLFWGASQIAILRAWSKVSLKLF